MHEAEQSDNTPCIKGNTCQRKSGIAGQRHCAFKAEQQHVPKAMHVKGRAAIRVKGIACMEQSGMHVKGRAVTCVKGIAGMEESGMHIKGRAAT